MPSLSDWTDDDLSRLGANVAEVLDLGRYYGNLDPLLLAKLSSLDLDITSAGEERNDQRGEANPPGILDTLNDGEVASGVLACAMLAGLDEAHPGVLIPEFSEYLLGLTTRLLTTQRHQRRKSLKEKEERPMSETASEPDEPEEVIYDADEFDDDIPVP